LAVAKDKKVIRRIHKPLNRRHSAQLLSFIGKALNKAKIKLRDIDGICIGKGPGSFTGLRIGITAVKALAYVAEKPVVAISSLDILAQNLAKSLTSKDKSIYAQICTIIDAKQNKVYACIYQAKDGKIKKDTKYSLLKIEDFLKRLKGNVIFTGDGIAVYKEKILKNKKIKPTFSKETFWYPKVDDAIGCALERFKNRALEDISSLTPLYLYPKECQVKVRRS
jgi:tRNA threonylcarbamoyladenosine biosynthesis protein TsaB